jgi:hypothetical protein
MLNSEAEKTAANLSILGDPYYISDSGIGNFSNSNYSSRNNVTDSGNFDYQKGEVDILFNFLTPVDLSESGKLLFDKDFDTILEIPFSGLYFIRMATSTFSKGKFTQELNLVRRPNQNTKGTLNAELAAGETAADRDDAETGRAMKANAAAADASANADPEFNAGTENARPPQTASTTLIDP